MILFDTNILIEIYKGNEYIINQSQIVGNTNISISIITALELIYGSLNKKEFRQMTRDIESLNVIHVTREISLLSYELMSKYALSHRITIPDCLIAATAINEGLSLFTLNLNTSSLLKDLIFITKIIFSSQDATPDY